MSSSAVAGILGGAAVTILLIMVVVWILLIVARWKIFTKAGEAGWKSIIPIYSDYVQWRIGWKKTGMFWAYIGLVIVGSVLMSMGGMTADQMTGAAAVNMSALSNPILAYIGIFAMLAGAVISLIAAYKLFQSFGSGIGMFIAYIFFAPIVLLVLGFGSAQWRGPQD